jgi:hypothetical protein
MINNEFMEALPGFKAYMSSEKAPSYVRRYCECLDDGEWKRFFCQCKEPLEFVADTKFFFYILKWILKTDFDDLSFEVYVQYVMDPEGRYDGTIKPEWIPRLEKRYGSMLDMLFSEICENASVVSNVNIGEQVFFGDSLPF